MAHPVGIGGREFSLGRLAGCRCPFTESTLTVLPLRIWTCKTVDNTKSRRTQTHHEIHSSPATATTSRRRATKHVPHVNPCSPASIDPRLVEIGLVQISQSITRRMLHIHREINRQADRPADR